MTRPLGDRIATQADCLREIIKLLVRARALIPPTILVAGGEEAIEFVYDDIDAATAKFTTSLGRIEALLEEMEQV